MKALIVMLAIAGIWILALGVAYGNTLECFSGNLLDLHILNLDDVIECLDDRINDVEARITTLESANGTDSTTASNLGSVGEGIFASEVGNDLQFKKLVNGTNITLSSNGTRIMINATGGSDDTVCANVGSGSQVYKDGECNFRTLIGSSDISVSQQTNTITIDFNGTVGGSDDLIGQAIAVFTFSQTKTNIGSSYVDIYSGAFQEEYLVLSDFSNVTYVRIYWMWDYVGTGSHQVRWCGFSGCATQQLFESSTFTSDCGNVRATVCDSGWFALPSSFNSLHTTITWQGKSTTSTDDPIAKGYKIMVK